MLCKRELRMKYVVCNAIEFQRLQTALDMPKMKYNDPAKLVFLQTKTLNDIFINRLLCCL